MAESLGKQLYRYRHKAGLSLRRLGDEIGVSFSTLARIERGEGQPDAHTRWAVERWIFPSQAPQPCPCARCSPPTSESRLGQMEERIRVLEERVEGLQPGLDRALWVTWMHEPIGSQ